MKLFAATALLFAASFSFSPSAQADVLCVRRGALKVFGGTRCPKYFSKFQVSTLGTDAVGKAGEPGLQGPQGPQGFAGPKGDTGPQGPAGISPRGDTDLPLEETFKAVSDECREVDLSTLCNDGDGCVLHLAAKVTDANGIASPDIREAHLMFAESASGTARFIVRDPTALTSNASEGIGADSGIVGDNEPTTIWFVSLEVPFGPTGLGAVSVVNASCSGEAYTGVNKFHASVHVVRADRTLNTIDAVFSVFDK